MKHKNKTQLKETGKSNIDKNKEIIEQKNAENKALEKLLIRLTEKSPGKNHLK